MNNSRYHTAGLRALPHECAVIRLSAFGENAGEKKLFGPETIQGHGSGRKGSALCENITREVTVYMGIFRRDGGTAARKK